MLANPPYVRQELIREQKPALQKAFPEVYTGTADLYVFFYARALQLLREGGMLVFISSNKWFRAAYGAKLRAHMAAVTDVRSITDFGELPVFQSAATFPMILVTRKCAPEGGAPVFTQVKTLEPPYPDVLTIIREQGERLPTGALSGAAWTLTGAAAADRLRKMERAGIPLGEYVNGAIYYGVKTGFNTAFVIDGAKRDELIQRDPKSAEIIKPLAVGDDVRRWRIERRDRWLIFARRGIDINTYPAVKSHLAQWRKQLEPRPRDWDTENGEWPGRKPGSYKWCEIQDEVAYFREFDRPKVVYPEICKERRFSYDHTGTFVNNKGFIMPTDDLYLLGVLNSEPAWTYAKSICAALGNEEDGGRLMLQWVNFSRLPIADASTAARAAVSALVQKCLDARGVGCEAWEKEIDERVAALYGL